jgi:hypothetical protein
MTNSSNQDICNALFALHGVKSFETITSMTSVLSSEDRIEVARLITASRDEAESDEATRQAADYLLQLLN